MPSESACGTVEAKWERAHTCACLLRFLLLQHVSVKDNRKRNHKSTKIATCVPFKIPRRESFSSLATNQIGFELILGLKHICIKHTKGSDKGIETRIHRTDTHTPLFPTVAGMLYGHALG
jgi:hypothetical protein